MSTARGKAAIFVSNQWSVEKPPLLNCRSPSQARPVSSSDHVNIDLREFYGVVTNTYCRLLRVLDSHVTVDGSGRKLSFPHNRAKLCTIDLARVKCPGVYWNLEAAHLRLTAAICECYSRVSAGWQANAKGGDPLCTEYINSIRSSLHRMNKWSRFWSRCTR